MRRKKIYFILPGLTFGGAERIIFTILNHLDYEKFQPKLILFDKIGKPYGECTGSVCTQIYPIQKNYIFKKSGIYIVKVVHLMRQEPLLGVKDVGIMVEKVK